MRKLLTILFSLLSFIAISQNCPDLGPNQILPCGVNSTVLTADLTACVAGTNPNQTTNYSVSPITYSTQTNTGTQLFMTDDSQQGAFPIGFNFCFFGQTYNQFYIGSNGWISFSPGQPTTFSSISIPSAAATTPKNCIMGPWQDWHPGLGGQIRYQTTGVAPCRKLTVSWTNVPMFSCTSLQGTFHIVIYESSNNIENYIQTKPNCLSWPTVNPGSAVQGLHNSTGTTAVTVPGRNGTVWTVTNDAYKYTPSGPVVTPVLTWYQVGNPVAIGTGPSITVNPLIPTQYTCHFVYPICNTGWSTCNAVAGPGPDTVLVVPGPPNLLPANMTITNPLCFGWCDGTATANPVNGTPIYTYLWSNGQTTQTATNLCPGVYNVVITDANGCSGASTVTLTNPPMIVAGPINYSDTLCFNSTNEVYTVPNLGPGYTYTWSSVGGITYGQGTDSINVDWLGISPGFTPTGVMVTATDSNGCSSLPASIDLQILNITPTITPIGPLCSNDPCVNLNGLPLGGQFTGDCVTSNQFCPDQSVNTNNNIIYTYTLSGCTFTSPATVVVNQQPVISGIVPDDELIELCDGDSINRIYSIASIFMGYNDWTVLGNTTQSTSLNVTWNQLGIYTISVIRYSNGCPSEPQTTTVNLVECPRELIYIPNSFTPDGNELNNIWLPVFTSGYDEYNYNLLIYNRWGEIIFESNKANIGWDGTYNNVMCPQGIYAWKISYGNKKDDGKKVITGSINLIR